MVHGKVITHRKTRVDEDLQIRPNQGTRAPAHASARWALYVCTQNEGRKSDLVQTAVGGGMGWRAVGRRAVNGSRT